MGVRALLSVYDKTGLVEFAHQLVDLGFELVSSGGTAQSLQDVGIAVTPVEEVTGTPEMFDGRVKTLHPAIHAGILARSDRPEDMKQLAEHGFEPFTLVVSNLYPFVETLAVPDASEEDLIERIDIGGPAMVRAAAKNYSSVGIVTSPSQYPVVIAHLQAGTFDADVRRDLAATAFALTTKYDAAISGWLASNRTLHLEPAGTLRYGENPHQEASLLREVGVSGWWNEATQIQGKEMSFNNYVDAEAAWRLANDLPSGSAVVVKHANPAGAAWADSLSEAFERAWDGDSLSAFGGVVAINGVIDAKTSHLIADRFIEVVVASGVEPSAAETLAGKKNMRVLVAPPPNRNDPDYRRIDGGFLVQERDLIGVEEWSVVSERQPSQSEMDSLRFCNVIAGAAKSNSIVIAKGSQAVGVGAGDQSRVGAAERAVIKAGNRATGAVAASDAFFPFRDGLEVLAAAGVVAVVEPGGSRNDDEVIEAANQANMVLVFSGRRHFKH